MQKNLQSHPEWTAVVAIFEKLRDQGYTVYLAGGCVRDAALGKMANDLDIATDATPDEVEKLFSKTVAVGKSFGVIRVLEAGADIEVASFRSDGSYADGRRPQSVSWAPPKEDARRRDFTVNALFWDLEKHIVVDFVDGLKDLNARLLRAVGDPQARFAEDHLRLLRVVRFAGQLDFQIEADTLAAAKKSRDLISLVSGERLREELTKLLNSDNVNRALELLHDTGMQKVLFPYQGQKKQIPKTGSFESWHPWVLFFLDDPILEVEASLEKLKFSNKETSWILAALRTFNSAKDFLSSRLGQQLEALQNPGVSFAFSLFFQPEANSLFDKELKNKIVALKALSESWGGTLPAPLLRGDDIKGQLSGADIKKALSEAYWLQLERALTSKVQALDWFKQYLDLQAKDS